MLRSLLFVMCIRMIQRTGRPRPYEKQVLSCVFVFYLPVYSIVYILLAFFVYYSIT